MTMPNDAQHLLEMLDIDPMYVPDDYDHWGGNLWSYYNDLESMENHLTYVYEMYDEDTGEGKEEYQEALREYNVKISLMKDEVLNHLARLQ